MCIPVIPLSSSVMLIAPKTLAWLHKHDAGCYVSLMAVYRALYVFIWVWAATNSPWYIQHHVLYYTAMSQTAIYVVFFMDHVTRYGGHSVGAHYVSFVRPFYLFLFLGFFPQQDAKPFPFNRVSWPSRRRWVRLSFAPLSVPREPEPDSVRSRLRRKIRQPWQD